MAIPRVLPVCQWKLARSITSKKYTDSLPKAARERYIRKLQCLYGVIGELRDEKCTLDHTLYKAMAALITNMADITAVNGLNGHALSRL